MFGKVVMLCVNILNFLKSNICQRIGVYYV
ncbi:MAG: hypothetical protein RL707_1574, partial [Pseudomonadota bacterium]